MRLCIAAVAAVCLVSNATADDIDDFASRVTINPGGAGGGSGPTPEDIVRIEIDDIGSDVGEGGSSDDQQSGIDDVPGGNDHDKVTPQEWDRKIDP